MKITKWKTLPTTYVDVETGEALTQQEVEQHYIIIKKQKNATLVKEINKKNKNRETIGYRSYTAECSRTGKQLKLL